MEGIRGIQHPLQTPLILDCIFKNLKIDDLQVCREVCRTWCHESGKALRALAKVTFVSEKEEPSGPAKFLELVKSDDSTFFQAPFADTFTFLKGDPDYPEFWENCGAHIKSLRFKDVTFASADTFRQAIFQNCSNLQKLELVDVQVLGEAVPEPKEWVPPQFTPNRNLKTLSFLSVSYEFRIRWFEILNQFPCLEKLLVREMGDQDQLENIFRALQVCRQHDLSSWNIKEATLTSPGSTITVPPSFARVFGEEGGLNLTTLSIKGIAVNTEEDVTTVQKILVSHAHSLKKLSLYLESKEFPETDIFPLPGNLVLESVQALKLLGNNNMGLIRLLQSFPNVKKLVLEVDEISEDTETPNVTLEQCTELTVYNQFKEIDDFKRLFGLLPNLKKLKIEGRLDNEWFSLICGNWPDLTHLELGYPYQPSEMLVDDADISGFDEEDVRDINMKGRNEPWRPITVRRANLSSLKSLRSFWWLIESKVSPKVGCCSEAYGILELPKLKHLRVKRKECKNVNGFRTVFVPMFESLSKQFLWDDSQKISFD